MFPFMRPSPVSELILLILFLLPRLPIRKSLTLVRTRWSLVRAEPGPKVNSVTCASQRTVLIISVNSISEGLGCLATAECTCVCVCV